MNRLKKFLNNIISLDQNAILRSAITKNEKAIIRLNTMEQIYKQGITSEGNLIRPKDKSYPLYSVQYTNRKKRLGILQGHIDLSLSGAYLKSWQILQQAGSYKITGQRYVTGGFQLGEHLVSRYGNIEGLTDENMNIVKNKYILPAINKAVLKCLRA